jgi:two-component system, NarL family, response regulator NreC
LTIRILLADDHALVRAGLIRIIASYPDCEVVGEAADGIEAVRLAREHAPDLVLLDITMPKRNGLDSCKEIVQGRPQTNIILLSMHKEEHIVLRGFDAGAKGYVVKNAAPEELEQAVRIVARGGTFISPLVTGRIVEDLRRGVPQAPANELSARQRQVLQLIAEGSSTREIADRLYLSVKTVETHRAQIMRKLDIYDIAHLTRYAIRVGLIQPEG